MWRMPCFCEVIDKAGQTHLVSLDSVSRISYLGTQESPGVEVYIKFGSTLQLEGKQAKGFLRILRDWSQVVKARRRQEP
jgi:hypothetical protein